MPTRWQPTGSQPSPLRFGVPPRVGSPHRLAGWPMQPPAWQAYMQTSSAGYDRPPPSSFDPQHASHWPAHLPDPRPGWMRRLDPPGPYPPGPDFERHGGLSRHGGHSYSPWGVLEAPRGPLSPAALREVHTDMDRLDRALRERHPELVFPAEHPPSQWPPTTSDKGAKDAARAKSAAGVGAGGSGPREGPFDRIVHLTLLREERTAALEVRRHGAHHPRGLSWPKTDYSASSSPPERLAAHAAIATIRVTIGKGRSLAAKDFGGTSDPYCELWVGHGRVASGRYYRTTCKPTTLSPVWNESAIFDVEATNELLHLVMFDKNHMNAHTFMGELQLHLCELVPGGAPIEGWFPLEQPASIEGAVTGEVQLTVALERHNERWKPSATDVIKELNGRLSTELSAHRKKNVLSKDRTMGGGRPEDKIVALARPRGKLRMAIKEARNLIAADEPSRDGFFGAKQTRGTSDPYCSVHLEQSAWSTTKVDKTCSPQWTQDGPREIPFASIDSLLHVVIFDYDFGSSDDYLGEVLLPLSELHAQGAGEIDAWFKVQAPLDRQGEPVDGQVRMVLELIDYEDGPAAEPTPNPHRASSTAPSEDPLTPGRVMSKGLDSTGKGAVPTTKNLLKGVEPPPPAPALGDEVLTGTFWRSMLARAPSAPSRYDLSGAGYAADVRKRMGSHRVREGKLFQVFGRGAQGVRESIGSVAPEHTSHHLTLKLLHGADLLAADANGTSDPYCDIHVWCPEAQPTCEHMWRSETCMQTLQPKWNKVDWGRAPLASKRALLHLVCFDWDRQGSDDYLGECLLDLSYYADGKPHQLKLWLDQYDKDASKDPITGWVMVEIQLRPAGRKASKEL